MERKIGEILEHNGDWYQCVKCDSCGKCSLRTTECGSGIKSDLADEVFGECSKIRRSDSKHVIFKKLEKVGEPYEYFMQGTGIILVQEYILASQSYICGDEVIDCQKDGRVAIEIKQNKEDMEEKKQKLDKLVEDYSYNRIPYEVFDNCLKQLYVDKRIGENNPSLKEFDLEAAKAGKPVCTKDGRKARIICFDRNDLYPIVALIECEDGKEMIGAYSKDGHTEIYEIKGTDLMMLPEKKEGWVNVYKGGLLDTKSYNTRKEAFDKACPKDYVDTVKINWSE